MMTDKLNEDKFGEMLGRALQSHSEPVPADFTERMLRQVREAEEQRILARVVLQERLALAACIVLGVIAIVAVAVFPDRIAEVLRSIAANFTEQGKTLVNKMTPTVDIEAVSGEVSGKWQFYTVLALVFGFAIYSLVDILVGDRLRRGVLSF
jgi:uncharacterized membrane protein